MRERYHGTGTVSQNGSELGEAGYNFELSDTGGLAGCIWSDSGNLPVTRSAQLILHLYGHLRFVSICLGRRKLDIVRMQHRYEIALSRVQPDDPMNLYQARQQLTPAWT